jgi:hypothetical protein
MRFQFRLSYLLVYVQLPEDLGCVQEMLVLKDSAWVSTSACVYSHCFCTYFLPFQINRGRFRTSASQYPLMRKRIVRKPCTAASGMM